MGPTHPKAEEAKRTTKGERTRKRILEVALDLFREHGYEETTMRTVKELVEAQGGTVSALPRPTGGTRFVVTMPVAQTSGSSRISTLPPPDSADAGNDSTARLT